MRVIPAKHRAATGARLAVAAEQQFGLDLERRLGRRRDVRGLDDRLDASRTPEQQPARLVRSGAARMCKNLLCRRAENFETHVYID